MNVADDVGVTFVNVVVNRGILNGVINISFGTYNFTPEGDKVNPDLVISSRLRMDLTCAQQLCNTLGSLLQAIEQESSASPVPSEGVNLGKPN